MIATASSGVCAKSSAATSSSLTTRCFCHSRTIGGQHSPSKHQRTRANHLRLNLVPDQRQFRNSAHAAANGDETNRTGNQPLQSFVEMWRRNFVSEIAIGLGLELIHDDAEHAAAALVRSATGRFHHAEIAAGANRETRIGQQLANAARLLIFRIRLTTFGAAENSDDAFAGSVAHGHSLGTSPLTISEPAARYSSSSSRVLNEPPL